MLRSTLLVRNEIDISKYQKLQAFLKRQGDNYKPKKSKVLSKDEIDKFITEALDDTYLMIKVNPVATAFKLRSVVGFTKHS
jgi:hypothetical protein